MTLLVKRNRPALTNWADDFFGRDLLNNFFDSHSMTLQPSVNIAEGEKEYRIELAAPGLEKEDFKVNLEDGILVISSEKEMSETEKNEKFVRREFHYASFKKAFSLPEEVDLEKIDAVYEKGILKMTLPKKEAVLKAEEKRQISIR